MKKLPKMIFNAQIKHSPIWRNVSLNVVTLIFTALNTLFSRWPFMTSLFELDEVVLQLGDEGRQVRLFVKVGPLLFGQVDVGEDGPGLAALVVVAVLASGLKKIPTLFFMPEV
jgi:hypothetical protein